MLDILFAPVVRLLKIHSCIMSLTGYYRARACKMDRSVGIVADESSIMKAVKPLPEDFDPTAVIKDPVPPVVENNGSVHGATKMREDKSKREIVLGKNVHTSCLEVTEPDADDEMTGDREAYMASVLARYRKSLMERTKHHLGLAMFPLTQIASSSAFLMFMLF